MVTNEIYIVSCSLIFPFTLFFLHVALCLHMDMTLVDFDTVIWLFALYFENNNEIVVSRVNYIVATRCTLCCYIEFKIVVNKSINLSWAIFFSHG